MSRSARWTRERLSRRVRVTRSIIRETSGELTDSADVVVWGCAFGSNPSYTMDEILIACGDVDRLRRIVSDLDDRVSNPLATRTGSGMIDKVARRHISLAIIHEPLQDGGARELGEGLMALSNRPPILWLTESTPPDEGPFDRAMRYPVPGPVLRNAVEGLSRTDAEEDLDLERWKAFYREARTRLEALPEQTYFEMLGVDEDAPHHAIVEAFDRWTTRYHPDRYQQYRDREWGQMLHECVSQLYASLTEAYQVLSDRRLRKVYERELQKGELRLSEEMLGSVEQGPESLTDLSSSSKSERFLEMAQRELAKDNPRDALQHLEFAASVEPDNEAIAERIDQIEADLEG